MADNPFVPGTKRTAPSLTQDQVSKRRELTTRQFKAPSLPPPKKPKGASSGSTPRIHFRSPVSVAQQTFDDLIGLPPPTKEQLERRKRIVLNSPPPSKPQSTKTTPPISILKGGTVRSLKDMTEEEIVALEKQLGAKILRPRD